MTPETASGHLERARAAIRQALAGWNPADLERVDHSRQLLIAAVAEMRCFEEAAHAGGVPSTPEIRAQLAGAKQEIVRATRVVDACLAFHRGLLAFTGDTPGVYDSQGRLAGEPSGMEPEVHA